VLGRIFEPKREEVEVSWRSLHNEQLHYFYASPNIIRVIQPRRVRVVGHAGRTGEMKNEYNTLVGKPEVKRTQGRPRR
jgi:hypothetical protein